MKYQHQLDLLRVTRNNVLRLLEPYTVKQMNQIPTGFNNNLVWHLGHLVVTHQLLCYGKSGLDLHIPREWVAAYRKGSKPTDRVDAADIAALKTALINSVDQFERDLAAGIFTEYNTYSTSFGTTLHNIDEATTFNNMHEAMHLGALLMMIKFV